MKVLGCIWRALCLVLTFQAPAQALTPLDEEALASVAGRDGVSFAVHLELNQPNSTDPFVTSRITTGFTVDGKTNYAVMLNPRGILDMFAVSFDVVGRPDGGDAIAVGLPGYVRFQQLGFDALGIQSDPNGPISGDLGSVKLNGQLSFQGQLRIWSK